MRISIASLLLLAGLTTASVAAPPAGSHPPVQLAQSQAELTEQAVRDFKAADAALNKVYRQVMSKMTAGEQAHMATCQLAWIKFRDEDATARAFRFKGGTIEPMAEFQYKTETTTHRTAELQQFLLEITHEGWRGLPNG